MYSCFLLMHTASRHWGLTYINVHKAGLWLQLEAAPPWRATASQEGACVSSPHSYALILNY